MKAQSFLAAFALVLVSALSSCKCYEDDCSPSVVIPFNFIESSSGSDFFFELDYPLDKLVIVSHDLDTLEIRDTNLAPPSLLVTVVHGQHEYVVHFEGETYPFSVQWERSKEECCLNELLLINEVRFSNEVVEPDTNGYYRVEF